MYIYILIWMWMQLACTLACKKKSPTGSFLNSKLNKSSSPELQANLIYFKKHLSAWWNSRCSSVLQCKVTSSLFSIKDMREGGMLTLPVATVCVCLCALCACLCAVGISRHAETARRQSAAHVERGRDPARREARFDQSVSCTIILPSSAHQQFN